MLLQACLANSPETKEVDSLSYSMWGHGLYDHPQLALPQAVGDSKCQCGNVHCTCTECDCGSYCNCTTTAPSLHPKSLSHDRLGVPSRTSAVTPAWSHVLFDAPYNQSGASMERGGVIRSRLPNWSLWKEVVLPLVGAPASLLPGGVSTQIYTPQGIESTHLELPLQSNEKQLLSGALPPFVRMPYGPTDECTENMRDDRDQLQMKSKVHTVYCSGP